MRILLSNDDGVHAPGLRILYDELKKLGTVKVVAPLDEMSTTGHSLTLHKPLRLIQMERDFYGINGSPADCISLALKQVMKKKPDLVISGINRGANLGQDVFYSGTVSAAREATISGIPAIAVSLCVDFKARKIETKLHYKTAARVIYNLIQDLDLKSLPRFTFLNVNVPDLPLSKIKGIYPARQGFRHYNGAVVRRVDHRGKDYFWVGGQYVGFSNESDTDCAVVDRKAVAVTPIKLDTTDMSFLEEMKRAQHG